MEQDMDIPEYRKTSGTRVFALQDNKPMGTIFLSDTVRAESKEAIERLQSSWVQCRMLTGDNEETAKEIAEQLGMDGYFAQVLPDEKQDKIRELQNQGHTHSAREKDVCKDGPEFYFILLHGQQAIMLLPSHWQRESSIRSAYACRPKSGHC